MANTKKAIVNAYFDIAKKKNIDKITVKDLVDVCGMTRQSFYYHFQDIQALIEWTLNQYADLLLQQTEEADTLEHRTRIFVSSIQKHAAMVNALMKSKNRTLMEDILNATLRRYIETMIRQKNLFPDLSMADLSLVLSYYTYATAGVLIEYSRKGKFDVEQLTEQLCRMYGGKLFPLT